MKNLKSLLALALFVIISNVGFALPPYFYTNIAINTSGQLIPSTMLNVEISIFQNNSLVYKELHNGITSSQFSIFSVEVGTGVPQSPYTIADYTALAATVTVKTQARIDIGGDTWVSLGAVYNTNIINKGFTGNPAEIDLPAGMMLVGDASNNASAVTLSNDASINSTGALTISNNAITTSKIANGNVTYSKIQSASNPNLMLISNSANNWIETTVSTVGVNLLNIANGNANQYLTSNGDGTVQWSDFLSPSWGLTGNTGTIDGTNYIGTTDNVALNFKVNNQKSGRIGTVGDGSVFLGYQAGANDDLSNNRNVFVGYQAGYSNTAGFANTANGYQALYSNTGGYENTANGSYALYSNTTGKWNTANGTDALYSNTTGSYNTANGSSALYSNITGFANTANGYGSLYSNTTGYNNTANGSFALSSNTTGAFNTANGSSALLNNTTGFANTANGYQTLYSNTTGSNNTANGFNALYNNTEGNQNTATGNAALYSNTTGYENTANGRQSLYWNTTGSNNTANGQQSLYWNTTGSNNTANGQQSLFRNTTGHNNTATGLQALVSNTDGIYNTANGAFALYFHTTGNNNVALGYNAGYGFPGANFNQCTFVGSNSYPTTARTNVTMLGYGIADAQCTGDNQVILGNNSVTGFYVGTGSLTTTANSPNLYYDNTTGQIMRSTASLGGSGWGLTGNSGTIDGTNYIGTTDNVALNFKVNNEKSGRIGTSADGSVFLGYQAGANDDLSNNRNVFVGYQAGYSNTTGFDNTANGYQALYSNTAGYENTANGSYALYSNTTGKWNTANGSFALSSNTTGGHNTANGYGSLSSNTTGYENTANGYGSLSSNTTGNNNTANGSYALYSNTSGSSNTAYGLQALDLNTTGNNNVALGYNAGRGDLGANFNNCTFVGSNSYPTTNRTNVTMLGYGITEAQCTGDNQVLLGNTSITQIRAQVGSITTYSDGRYKTNIENNVHGLDFVMKLKPITYSTDPRKLHKIWGTADSVIEKMDVSDAMSKRYIGFIAQDVEQAAKETGFAFPGIDVPKNDKEVYTLRYVDFIMPMVKSIQEQQTIIESLKNENKELQLKVNHITQLEQENQLLQTQMATMMQEIEKIKQEMANKEKDSNNNEELFGEKK